MSESCLGQVNLLPNAHNLFILNLNSNHNLKSDICLSVWDYLHGASSVPLGCLLKLTTNAGWYLSSSDSFEVSMVDDFNCFVSIIFQILVGLCQCKGQIKMTPGTV